VTQMFDNYMQNCHITAICDITYDNTMYTERQLVTGHIDGVRDLLVFIIT